MLTARRHREIVSHIEKRGSAKVTELAALFAVTKETIRRDLEKLEQEGKLLRRRGGAISQNSLYQENALAENRVEFVREKTAIASEALKRIVPGDTILIDSSTTTWQMARMMPDIPITVLTSSLRVVLELASRRNLTCICLGGTLAPETLSLVGPIAERVLGEYHVDKLFLSCRGAELHRGCSDSNEWQAILKRQMMAVADKRYLLAVHNKLGAKGLTVFAPLTDFDEVITDWATEPEMIEKLRAKNVPLTIASRSE